MYSVHCSSKVLTHPGKSYFSSIISELNVQFEQINSRWNGNMLTIQSILRTLKSMRQFSFNSDNRSFYGCIENFDRYCICYICTRYSMCKHKKKEIIQVEEITLSIWSGTKTAAHLQFYFHPEKSFRKNLPKKHSAPLTAYAQICKWHDIEYLSRNE